MSPSQYNQIFTIVNSNKDILNFSHMLRINKIVSCMSFMIKEIYDFLNLKTKDGTLIVYIKKQKNDLNKLKEKNAKIVSILKSNKELK